MNSTLSWNFVSTQGGDIDGLNNSMIEHFTGNHNYFLAREIIQNSLDAKAKGLTTNLPVQVTFKLEYIKKQEFPGYLPFLKILDQAKLFWKTNKETILFLDRAKKCLEQDRIPCLRISDFNTTGLNGNDTDMEGGWFNLVRSTGASFKTSGEGGSFGIGKGAPFAASDIRTVFYSTKNEKNISVFQGKSELVSFADEKGDVKRGVCSFGIGQSSVRDPKQIPNGFWRQIQGTDIFIAGYKLTGDWVEDLLKSVLRNFWFAIHCKDLTVTVENSAIDSQNLSEYLVKYFIDEPFKDYVEPTGNPLQYYLAVTKGEELGKGKKLKDLGECKFHFKLIESHMNYVAMLRRSHMVIYSRRFNFPGNFAGVFICDNDKGNLALRRMEPPAHDKWDPKRNKESGESIMNEITRFVRECLESVKQRQSFGILDIPELQKYLPYDDGEESGDGTGSSTYTGREGKEETSRLIQKSETINAKVVVNPYKVTVLNEKEDFGGTEEGLGTIRNNGNNGGTTHSGGGIGSNKTKKVKDFHARSFLLKGQANSFTYRIVFHSNKDLKCNLNLSAVGEEGSEKLLITDVTDNKNSKYLFSANKIQQVKLIKDQPKTIDVTINSPFKLSLKVTAHDLQ
jgi:hypothetical protein